MQNKKRKIVFCFLLTIILFISSTIISINADRNDSAPPDLTIFIQEINDLNVTINGVVMPGTDGTTITSIHWDWDDGNSEDHWFPVDHTYLYYGAYIIEATAYQSDGLYTRKTTYIYLSQDDDSNITIEGNYSGFYDFPSSFFNQSFIPKEDVVNVTDAQYLSLLQMHNGIHPYDFCIIEYDPDVYGGTTPTGLKLGDAAFPSENNGNHRWEVMAHEQGHNFFGGTSAFYGSLAFPYPFLQESLAVLSAFYTYHIIIEDNETYNFSVDVTNSLNYDFGNGRNYQENMYNQYINLI